MNNWQWKRFNFCIFLCFFTPLSHVVITQVPISTWNNLPTIDAIMAVRTVKTLSNCVICIFMNISNWNDCLLLMPTKRRQCRTQKKQYAWNCHVQIAIDILYGDKNMFAPMHKLEEKKRHLFGMRAIDSLSNIFLCVWIREQSWFPSAIPSWKRWLISVQGTCHLSAVN